jgi:hypothetical protein
MPDPEMVSRAHRAAAMLEQAWERWRVRHGLTARPMPPVSSYVGYSIEEPWGRPRVVLGVDAHEAEVLAALLDSHEFATARGLPGQAGMDRPDPSGGDLDATAGQPDQAGLGDDRDTGYVAGDVRARVPAQVHSAEAVSGHGWPGGRDSGGTYGQAPTGKASPRRPVSADVGTAATGGGTRGDESRRAENSAPVEPALDDIGGGPNMGAATDASALVGAGTTADAGAATDASALVGAGTTADAGAATDASALVGAGTTADAGAATDASALVGAGTTADAGTQADADLVTDPGAAAVGDSADLGYPAQHPAPADDPDPAGAATGTAVGVWAADEIPAPRPATPHAGAQESVVPGTVTPRPDAGRPGTPQADPYRPNARPDNRGAGSTPGNPGAGSTPGTLGASGPRSAGQQARVHPAGPTGSPSGHEGSHDSEATAGPGGMGTSRGGVEYEPAAFTARPHCGSDNIAAELAGWAAGELPGQASARLAAWAAVGGVPVPGYRANGTASAVATGPVATGPVATGPVATGPVATGTVATSPVATGTVGSSAGSSAGGTAR